MDCLYLESTLADQEILSSIMSDLEKSFRELSKTENVFMFVPNLIGYGRILLALLSFWFMPTNYVAAAWCYILSGQYGVY